MPLPSLHQRPSAHACVLALFLLGSALGAPVLFAADVTAQSGPAPTGPDGTPESTPSPTTPAATPTPTPTPTGEGTASNNSSGGALLNWSGGAWLPSAKQRAIDMASDPILNASYGYVPTTGMDLAAGKVAWDNQPYSQYGWVLQLSWAIAAVVTVGGAATNTIKLINPLYQNTHKALRMVARSLAAIVIGLGGYFTVVGVMYAIAGDLARSMGNAAVTSESALFKLGVLTGFALGSLTQLGWDLLVALGASYILTWGVLALVALLGPPIYVGAIYWRGSSVGRACSTVIRMQVALAISPIVQGFFITMALTNDWSVSFSGIMTVLGSFVLTFLAIITPLFMVVLAFLSRGRAISFASMGLASVAGSSIAARAGERAKEKKDEAVERGKRGVKNKAGNARDRVGDRTRAAAAGVQQKKWERSGAATADVGGRDGRDYRYDDDATGEDATPSRQAIAEHARQNAGSDGDRDGGESRVESTQTDTDDMGDESRAQQTADAQRVREMYGPGRSDGDGVST